MLEQRYGQSVDILTDKDDWSRYDHLWVTEGMNFREGVWNLFGGVGERLLKRLQMLADYEGELYYWGDFAPDYQDLCDKRGIDMFVYQAIEPVHQIIESDKIILGDSHTVSVYEPGWHIERMDGRTLYSLVKQDISYYGELAHDYDKIRFYAGNIDIRFHFGRLYDCVDMYIEIPKLVEELAEKLSVFDYVEVVDPLRNAPDDRPLPKTGYYKGNPFYGSFDAREEARAILSRSLKDNFDNVLEWPKTFHYDDVLSEVVMEARRSVHLAPKYYMFKWIS